MPPVCCLHHRDSRASTDRPSRLAELAAMVAPSRRRQTEGKRGARRIPSPPFTPRRGQSRRVRSRRFADRLFREPGSRRGLGSSCAATGRRLQPKRRRPFLRSSISRRRSSITVVALFPTTNSRNCACCPTERALGVSQQRRRNRIGTALCCGSHRRGPGFQQRPIGRGARRRSLKAVLST
jgi:hypothetical protein